MAQAHSILDRRRAGILLHITSLPGGTGNGDLGQDAHRFVDMLANSGITVWQTLPIGPTHCDGSPYQCLSAHAGNPLLINLDWLVERGWLPREETREGWIEDPAGYRRHCLKQACEGFLQRATADERQAFAEFTERQCWWLNDYALFISLREEHGYKSWQEWYGPLRARNPSSLRAARKRLAEGMEKIRFEQFVFFRQWQELRDHARQRGVLLFGDMPIFVAGDSSDVWACRDLFDLTMEGHARVVAGVPPDYFSATGQRWGNPHYRWDRMEADGFRWWLDRIRSQLELYDWVRIDHFRGFEAYWEIPAESDTAIEGRWVKAPGAALLEAAYRNLGGAGLPLVAENLGIITPEVEELRERFDIPGMLILQFAFDGGPGNPYLPHNHTSNQVVYTGTHDNDTSLSWFEQLPEWQQHHIRRYLGDPALPMPMALVQSALASVARLAILPMQDILDLGKVHRMNTPGTIEGNWNWRFGWEQVRLERLQQLDNLIRLYGRHPST